MRIWTLLAVSILLAACTGGRDYRINDEMNRSDLVLLPYQEQQQIISTLDPAVKLRLWKDKLSDTMASDRISQDEKSLLKELFDNLGEDAFVEGTEAYTSFQSASDKLVEVLTQRYGWTEEKLFLYLMTIMAEKELKDAGAIQNYLMSPMSDQDISQSGYLKN